MACFISILALLWWFGTKSTISLGYACTGINRPMEENRELYMWVHMKVQRKLVVNMEKQNSGIDPLLLRLTWEFAFKEEFGFICAYKLIAKLKEERECW